MEDRKYHKVNTDAEDDVENIGINLARNTDKTSNSWDLFGKIHVKTRSLNCKQKKFMVFIVIIMLLLLSTNLYNPTLLPVQLRFSPTCTRLDAGTSNTTSNITNIPRYTYPAPIKRDYAYFNDHSWLPRFNDMKTHEATIRLLGNISEHFRANNITYILIHGTLLGSYIFHDLIPWDDDVDIFVSLKSINRLRALLRSPVFLKEYSAVSFRDDFNIYAESYLEYDVNLEQLNCGNHPELDGKTCKHAFHLFRTDSPKTLHRKEVGYPYIDVTFYNENATHVWPIDPIGNDPTMYAFKDYYPIHQRPFFDLWQPVPNQTLKVLRMKFTQFTCASKWYSHHTQTVAVGYKAKCEYIMACYPYVKRSPKCLTNNDKEDAIEQLMIGSTVIYEAVIDEEFSDLAPFVL